jgi:hypothetical protein
MLLNTVFDRDPFCKRLLCLAAALVSVNYFLDHALAYLSHADSSCSFYVRVLAKLNVLLFLHVPVTQLPKLRKEIRDYLKDGVMTPDYVSQNIAKLMNTMRNANVTIRWAMLHSHVDVRIRLAEIFRPKR